MKCEQAQNIIITDFSDHEATPRLREDINQHLLVCPACRELENRVRTKLMQPFEHLVLKAPSTMWNNLQEKILSQPEPKKWYIHFIPTAISLPRLAMVSGLVLLVAGGAQVVYQRNAAFQHEAVVCVMENMNYMESLSNNEGIIENDEIEELI
jgi:predicted anti-sigma-YlaC factor YlaD